MWVPYLVYLVTGRDSFHLQLGGQLARTVTFDQHLGVRSVRGFFDIALLFLDLCDLARRVRLGLGLGSDPEIVGVGVRLS